MSQHLSAVDSVSPAFSRLGEMLFRPFRFSRWLKLGFIGWLAGAGAASLNFNSGSPRFPSGVGRVGSIKDLSKVIDAAHVFVSEHMHLIIFFGILIAAVMLVFVYLNCRFRFILFDAVLTRDPQIGRAWSKYAGPANRFFVFWVLYSILAGVVLFYIIVMPFWRAFRSGAFSGDDPLPAIFSVLGSMILGALLMSLILGIVTTLANDFIVPMMAVGNVSVGEAGSLLQDMVIAEPGAFAGYLGMKLVLHIGGAVCYGIALVICLVVLLIPIILLVLLGVLIIALLKSMGAFGAVLAAIVIVIGVLALAALIFVLSLATIAPFAVFFTSYALYFLGGRYPKL
ncbi:MAG TPA: hypothetical protein VEW69_11100, partial [Alphaproteobacteria bacterium]|nr:hypothetical protein [Alphaproteobacteria bacterium]